MNMTLNTIDPQIINGLDLKSSEAIKHSPQTQILHCEFMCKDLSPDETAFFLAKLLVSNKYLKEEDTGNIAMTLAETLSNALEHGALGLSSTLKDICDEAYIDERRRKLADTKHSERKIYLDIILTSKQLVIKVRDEGDGFDISRQMNKSDFTPEDLFATHGRGLLIINHFMDKVTFNQKGNEITLVKNLDIAANDQGIEERSLGSALSNTMSFSNDGFDTVSFQAKNIINTLLPGYSNKSLQLEDGLEGSTRYFQALDLSEHPDFVFYQAQYTDFNGFSEEIHVSKESDDLFMKKLEMLKNSTPNIKSKATNKAQK